MQTFNDFKNYKKYYPNYAEWKLERNLAEAKRAEFEASARELCK